MYAQALATYEDYVLVRVDARLDVQVWVKRPPGGK